MNSLWVTAPSWFSSISWNAAIIIKYMEFVGVSMQSSIYEIYIFISLIRSSKYKCFSPVFTRTSWLALSAFVSLINKNRSLTIFWSSWWKKCHILCKSVQLTFNVIAKYLNFKLTFNVIVPSLLMSKTRNICLRFSSEKVSLIRERFFCINYLFRFLYSVSSLSPGEPLDMIYRTIMNSRKSMWPSWGLQWDYFILYLLHLYIFWFFHGSRCGILEGG